MRNSRRTGGKQVAPEITNICPACGQVLVRPVDFSGERLLYLHQKWGGCLPAGSPVRADLVPDKEPTSRSAAG